MVLVSNFIDSKNYSSKPVARCASFSNNCNRGKYGYCYCKLPCSSKRNLNKDEKSGFQKILDKEVEKLNK